MTHCDDKLLILDIGKERVFFGYILLITEYHLSTLSIILTI